MVFLRLLPLRVLGRVVIPFVNCAPLIFLAFWIPPMYIDGGRELE